MVLAEGDTEKKAVTDQSLTEERKFPLPQLNVNPDTITVAGYSSGAIMSN